MDIQDKITVVLDYFGQKMPEVKSELHYRNPYELLVSTMLAAQCTDRRVNMVTPALFEAYPDAAALSKATADEILPFIKSVSYPNSKAAHLAAAGRMMADRFKGEVPHTMSDLVRLPGVGRKTANVVLAFAFGKAAMPVDTHVFRVANRIGLVENARTPEEVERQLTALIPHEKLSNAHHWLLLHGRYTCTARKPACKECPLNAVCDFFAAQ